MDEEYNKRERLHDKFEHSGCKECPEHLINEGYCPGVLDHERCICEGE